MPGTGGTSGPGLIIQTSERRLHLRADSQQYQVLIFFVSKSLDMILFEFKYIRIMFIFLFSGNGETLELIRIKRVKCGDIKFME